MTTLSTDRFGFPIVETAQQITEAREDGCKSVSVTCPGCGKQLIRTLQEAEFILEYGCVQHTKTDNL